MGVPLEREWSVDRWFGWLVAVFGCLVILDQVLFKLGSFPDFAPAWNALVVLVGTGFLALAIGGLACRPAVLTPVWSVLPPLYFAALATWPLAYRGERIDDVTLWAWALEPAVATLLVMLVRPTVAIALGIGLAVTPALSALLVLGTVPESVLLETPKQLGSLVYVGLFIGARYQLHRVVQIEEAAARVERRQRVLVAQAEEEARISRLVHDEVLSVLSAAINATDTHATLRASAAKAIGVLEGSPETPTVRDVRIDALEAASRAVSRLRSTDESISIETRVADGDIEESVVMAVSLASAEAVRNSLRHGGTSANRHAFIDVGQDRISLTVSDDGVGFNPGAEAPRLGIRNSIRGRMSDIGGDATIVSAIGEGTEVTASWTKKPSPAAR